MADRIFSRVCRVQALAILAAVALAYPLAIKPAALAPWTARFVPGALRDAFVLHFEPFLTFGCAPLLLKETLAGCGALALVWCFALWQSFWPRRDAAETRRILTGAGLLALAAASAVWRSPTFYYSLATLTRVACVWAFFCIVASLAAHEGEKGEKGAKGENGGQGQAGELLRRGAALIVALSALLALVALMQHFGLTAGALLDFADPRNRVGSFIGHNTGLSNYLMMSLMLAVALLFGRGSPVVKTLLGCAVALQCFVIVIAQSRAIWLIALVLTPILAVRLRRLTGAGPRLRHWAIIGVTGGAILATQLVESPVNVFGVRDYPLMRRIQDFRPDQLRRETRMRITVCSLPLVFGGVGDALVGHGLGSFQYVYPKAQMEYYEAHRDLWIEPTDKITDRAHNDYLQLLIETGLIGCALVAAYLWPDLRRGARSRRAAMNADPRGAAVRLGAEFALLGFALHALVDFPFHIVSLSATAAFLFGAWAGPRAPEEGRGDADEEATQASDTGTRGRGEGARTWKRLVLGIVAVAIVSVGVAKGLAFFARGLIADEYRARGDGAMRWALDNFAQLDASRRFGALAMAEGEFRRASRLAPLRADIHAGHAQTLALHGELLRRELPALEEDGRTTAAAIVRAQAASKFRSAFDHATEALNESRTHVSYMLLGSCAKSLYELTREAAWRRAAIENLELAARYSPSYAEAALALLSLYAEQQTQSERMMDLRRSIARYAPGVYRLRFKQQAYDLRYNGRFREAIPVFQALARVAEVEGADRDPAKAREAAAIWSHYIETLIDAARHDGDAALRAQAEDELRRAEARFAQFPWTWAKVRAQLLTVDGKWAEVAALVRQIIANNPEPGDNDFWETVEACALRQAGLADAGARLAAIRVKAREQPIYLMYLGLIAADYLGDRETAIRELSARCRLKPDADAYVHGRLALLLFEAGRLDEARAHAEAALKKKPDYPRMNELLAELDRNERAPG